MNAQSLLANFGYLANAPDGVKRLQDLIYHLAMTGGLCPQDPLEGSGSELLREIEKEKRNKLKDGSFKRWSKLVNFKSQYAHALPELPGNWAWARLVDIGEINPKNVLEDDQPSSFASMSAISEVHAVAPKTEERPWGSIKKGYTHFADGDVAVAKITPCFENGKAAVMQGLIGGGGAGTTELHVIRPLQGVDPRFVYAFLRSPYFKAVGEDYMTGTAGQKRLPTEYFATRPFPLPPLAEQERIVAKVDELMALCDKLEAQQKELGFRFPVLSRALHARFAESPTAENLKAIFDEADSVSESDLRETILKLAVRGKLVPQDPDDEPLQRSFSGLETVITNLDEDDRLPSGWEYCKYRSLTSLVTSGSRGWKEFYSESGAIFIRTQNIKTDALVLEDVAFVQLPKSAEGKRSRVLKDDILITITGANVTKAARVREAIPEAYVSQHIALTRPNWPEMSEWLYLCFVSHSSARGKLEELAYGDKPGLNLNNLRDLILPVPPLAEQRRIVNKVDQLMVLIDQLEKQQTRESELAADFAQATVVAITGTQFQESKSMKTPKTELITTLQIGTRPKQDDKAPLAELIAKSNGALSARVLWRRSGLKIDDFYNQLKTEMAKGWVVEPEPAVMKEVQAS